MPGIVTHHAFGRVVYRSIADEIGETEVGRQAFLLGCQGPDPFFTFTIVLPKKHPLHALGSMMHTQNTSELFCSIHDIMVSGEHADEATRAYALGFLGHFLLDSSEHPLVFSQQAAISGSVPEWAGNDRMSSVIHSTIETEWDEYVFSTMLGGRVSSMPPHKTMLSCPQAELLSISTGLGDVARRVFGMKPCPLAFYSAVHLFRLAQAMLASRSCGIRRRVDYLKAARLASAHIRSLSHVDAFRASTVFSNDDHIPWTSAFEDGEHVDSSFDELFSEAVEKAISIIPRFADDGLSKERCSEIVGKRDFHGRVSN